MTAGKEKAGDYEILLSTRLGGEEIILGHDDKNKEYPYMTSYRKFNFLGDEFYPDSIGSDDYLLIIKLYLQRLQKQVEKVEQFRAERNLPYITLGQEHCRRREENESLVGRLIILSPSSLAPEYRTADCQLGFATGGFGCSPDSTGRAVYFKELYSGQECRWNINNVLGIADIDKLPDWAKKKLQEHEQVRAVSKKARDIVR